MLARKKMKRKIVKIDEKKCNGCGICINACHEGALQLINGKARLVSESYCDGLGDCLPECPAGAITIEEREAQAYDEEAVKKHMESKKTFCSDDTMECGCPGAQARTIEKVPESPLHGQPVSDVKSQLRQWPCQIRLVGPEAPYLDNARLLIAADCTAYAYANIHKEFMRNKITLIGCPKLDDTDYSEKLGDIFKRHEIRSITVLKMEVPCCGGMAYAVKKALMESGKLVPWNVVTISVDGKIVDE
jgi:ferredoxin